jgi:hypothetical protein
VSIPHRTKSKLYTKLYIRRNIISICEFNEFNYFNEVYTLNEFITKSEQKREIGWSL